MRKGGRFISRSGAKKPSPTRKTTAVGWCSSLPYCMIAVGIWGVLSCLIALLLLGSSPYGQRDIVAEEQNADGISKGCRTGCSTTFGSILGVSNGVVGYSNCNSTTCISNTLHLMGPLMNTGDNTTESGLKWQCVEYARRYWMLRGTPVPATFASVVGAADIWDLETVQLLDSTTTPLLKYANGLAARVGGSAPRVGDLLVYPRQSGGFPFGHVAVIVGVKSESVLVAEQNWDNTVWPAPHHNYSREIPMQLDAAKNSYTIKEKDGVIVEGWVRYSA